MTKLTVAIIGCGQRGKSTYGELLNLKHKDVSVVGIAEPITERREKMILTHDIQEENAFLCYTELLEKERFCDAVLICTSDDLHFEPAQLALEKGYHVLLEKPMVTNETDLLRLESLISKYPNQVFMICHVLRYTPFFTKIKSILDSGIIGRLISVQANENIGYYHMAHSYVRGNWRNSQESSPIILAKSCHDLDIFNYLIAGNCTHVASFGELIHFKSDQQPTGASNRCIHCEVEGNCPYSALKVYQPNGNWPTSVITENPSQKDAVLEAIQKGPYGRCVYACDNDVVDHQATILNYDTGVTVTFNLSGFTHDISRTLKLMGTHGEIRAHMELKKIELHMFANNKVEKISPLEENEGHVGHGGGDSRLLEDFIKSVSAFKNGTTYTPKTTAYASIKSHKMAFAAECSRIEKTIISI